MVGLIGWNDLIGKDLFGGLCQQCKQKHQHEGHQVSKNSRKKPAPETRPGFLFEQVEYHDKRYEPEQVGKHIAYHIRHLFHLHQL